MEDFSYLERYIVTGLIVSSGYTDRIRRAWDPALMESPELRMVAEWCIEYYDQYQKVPDTTIEAIYLEKLKTSNISKTDAQYIEQVLTSISDEYGRGDQFNAAYLYDQSIRHFKARRLQLHNEEVQALIDMGDVEKAEQLAASFSTAQLDEQVGLELSSEEALDHVERAFTDTAQRVIQFPGALGQMWNDHLIRGGFVALLAPEKRGKSWQLLELALRSIRQRFNVAYFEAGDMTEAQVLKRICVNISRRSDRERYCQAHFSPVGDCILNQLDLCTRPDRNCDHGVFDFPLDVYQKMQDKIIGMSMLVRAYNDNPKYTPCDSHVCDARKGTVWIEKLRATRPLTGKDARRHLSEFFSRYKRRFRLVNYSAGTLSVSEMRKCLTTWERADRFVPDVIVIDYADLLTASDSDIHDYRHKQDHIWKGLRGLSQEKHCLVITATQADADSYTKGRLSLSNFSEDKRKLSHVTAMFGLNQDPKGREKRLGIMRINEIVVREGEFNPDNEVVVLQDLAIGRPFLESYKVPLNETADELYNTDEEE